MKKNKEKTLATEIIKEQKRNITLFKIFSIISGIIIVVLLISIINRG